MEAPGELRNRSGHPGRRERHQRVADRPFRIGVVATASRMSPEVAGKTRAIAAERYGAAVELVCHGDARAEAGHFAGDDATRAAAFVQMANDPAIDAVWIAR